MPVHVSKQLKQTNRVICRGNNFKMCTCKCNSGLILYCCVSYGIKFRINASGNTVKFVMNSVLNAMAQNKIKLDDLIMQRLDDYIQILKSSSSDFIDNVTLIKND